MRTPRKIYLASSWRNTEQPKVLKFLRALGHEVYDFRHPAEGNEGFNWREIDPAWQQWTPEQYRQALAHPVAEQGFKFDKDALDWCDTCVLLLPCGRSAHLEAGYAIGQGKPTIICAWELPEPELMYKLATIVPSLTALGQELEALAYGDPLPEARVAP